MDMLLKDPMVLVAVCFLACALCQWMAWRLRLPAIIFLLIAGLFAGPVFHLIYPEELLGDVFFPFVSLSVAIILFEGSLTLKIDEILGLHAVVRNMLTIGVLITWSITTLAAKFFAGVSWEVAALFGAITIVTGPTVIAPLLRTVRPTAPVANILRWEGIVIDPLGATFAVLVYEFILSSGGRHAFSEALLNFTIMLIASGGAGCLAGYCFGTLLRKRKIPDFLHNIVILSTVFCLYVGTNMIHTDSGLIAVTAMGIWLANMKGVDLDNILEFKEHLSILLVSLLFVLLTASLDIMAIKELGWSALFVFMAVQFLARPLNILASTVGSSLTSPERHLLAWIAPRGIVAAAISSFFGIQLIQASIDGAELLVPLTFTVIVGTVVLQSFTSLPIARWLGVAEPEPDGFLIIGANRVARAIASVLDENNIRVLLVDTGWEKISKAKNEGFLTYHGNPISDHSNRHMELVGIGRMLALSPYSSVNLAAVMHYRIELGKDSVFSIDSNDKSGLNGGKVLFGQNIRFSMLDELLEKGAKIHATQLTDQFTYEKFLQLQEKIGTQLFAINPKGRVFPFHCEKQWAPKRGWTIIYLSHTLAE